MNKRKGLSIEKLMMAFILLATLAFTCLENLYVRWRDNKPKPPLTGSNIQAAQTAYEYFYSGDPKTYLELKYLGKYMGDLWLLDYEITNHFDIAFRTTVYLNMCAGHPLERRPDGRHGIRSTYRVIPEHQQECNPPFARIRNAKHHA